MLCLVLRNGKFYFLCMASVHDMPSIFQGPGDRIGSETGRQGGCDEARETRKSVGAYLNTRSGRERNLSRAPDAIISRITVQMVEGEHFSRAAVVLPMFV